MRLTTSCQICGTILSVIEKYQITSDDINEYESNSYCNIVTNGVVDGQQDIQATMTLN